MVSPRLSTNYNTYSSVGPIFARWENISCPV